MTKHEHPMVERYWRSVGVALCHDDDAALREVFEAFPNMEVALDPL